MAVLGSHAMLADEWISREQNSLLADGLMEWLLPVSSPPPFPRAFGTASQYLLCQIWLLSPHSEIWKD